MRRPDTADPKQKGALNGRYWTSLTDNMQTFFLVGYLDAHFAYAPPFLNNSLPATVIGDIQKGLDRFYQDPENLRFPISAALRIFAMRVEGKSQPQIDSMLSVFQTMLKDNRDQFRIYDVAGVRSKANR
jgi:hypothetical protein